MTSLLPTGSQSLREEVLSIWFQAIVAPPSTWTVEPDLTAQLITLDANEPGSLFVVTPFARRALTDEDSMSEGEVEVEPADLRAKRGALFDGALLRARSRLIEPTEADLARSLILTCANSDLRQRFSHPSQLTFHGQLRAMSPFSSARPFSSLLCGICCCPCPTSTWYVIICCSLIVSR